jgi:hypothetical protein
MPISPRAWRRTRPDGRRISEEVVVGVEDGLGGKDAEQFSVPAKRVEREESVVDDLIGELFDGGLRVVAELMLEGWVSGAERDDGGFGGLGEKLEGSKLRAMP